MEDFASDIADVMRYRQEVEFVVAQILAVTLMVFTLLSVLTTLVKVVALLH